MRPIPFFLLVLLAMTTKAQVWLDPSFGSGGLVGGSLNAAYDGATSLALQTDGKIVVAGSISDGQGGWDFLVARYSADGILDDAFGTGGFTTHNVLTQDRSRGVAIQADGG